MADTYAEQGIAPDPNAVNPFAQSAPAIVPPAGESDPYKKTEPTASRKALVLKLLREVKLDERHWRPKFEIMRNDMKFAYGLQWDGQKSIDTDRYVANIVQRHINQRVASLYAKNPKAIAERKPRLDYEVWDENPQTLLASFQALAQAAAMGAPANPHDVQIMQDFERAYYARNALDRVGRTLEIVFQHFVDIQTPKFKTQMKHLVRRGVTCGVGYIRYSYQRELGRRPETEARIADIRNEMEHLSCLTADTAKNSEGNDSDPRLEEMRLMVQALQQEPEQLIRQGMLYQFPLATRIIPCRDTINLVGWIGTQRVSERFSLTADQIKEIYKVDIKGSMKSSKLDMDAPAAEIVDWLNKNNQSKKKYDVYEIFELASGLKYTACEAHDDFLEEPSEPDPDIEGFWPYEALVFNSAETEDEVFPVSDTRQMWHIQREYNRSREGLRQHRYANRPLYLSLKGAIENEEEDILANADAHSVIYLNALDKGMTAEQLIQAVKKIGIDPGLYETASLMDDTMRVVGSQEANLGGSAGGTATESSIAETSRLSSVASNIDDLDDLLSNVANKSGKVYFKELQIDQVKEIAGPGAVWPTLDARQIADQVFLRIEAGSSGRPNKAQELANFERAAPFLLQIPGIQPLFLAKYLLRIMDDRLDLTDILSAGIPSIIAMNGQATASTGNGQTDPNQQGAKGQQAGGANKAPAPAKNRGSLPPMGSQ